MQNTESIVTHADTLGNVESSHSAVRWGAVIAGTVIAVAVSTMLATAGTGLGFFSISPWSHEGVSGSTLVAGSIIWLIVTQIIAYGVAGYITGRLRTTWTDAEADEIYFRDTAHGFLVWALSAVLSLILLGSTVASVMSNTASAGTKLADAGASAVFKDAERPLDYFTDTLLRPASGAHATADEQGTVRPEVSNILARGLAVGKISDADQTYLTELIAQYAGVDQATAKERLTRVETQAKQTAQQAEQKARAAADTARKAMITFSLWAFVSLLIGAFVASFAATLGGRGRARAH